MIGRFVWWLLRPFTRRLVACVLLITEGRGKAWHGKKLFKEADSVLKQVERGPVDFRGNQ